MEFQYNPLRKPSAGAPYRAAESTDSGRAADGAPRIVARLRTAEHGHAALSRLAAGDHSVLIECGVQVRRPYDTRSHEWGMGRDRTRGDCYLIAGGPDLVDWDHPALRGLEPLAHTHSRHAIDRGEVGRDLAATLAGALNEWLVQMAGVPLGFMPGDLWYLFPSNRDLAAAYSREHQEIETVYAPFRLGPDGWLSAAPSGPTVNVRFGPVLARLRDDAADTVRRVGVDLADEASVRRVEEACLMYLWAPIVVNAGEAPIVSGVLQIDPVRGIEGRAPQFAWFRAQSPNGLRSRAQVRLFIANVGRSTR